MAEFNLKDLQNVSEICEKLREGLQPKIHLEEDRPHQASDFKSEHASTALNFALNLTDFLKSQDSNSLPKYFHENVVKILILLCGEHSESNLWTDSSKVAIAFRILSNLKNFYSVSSVNHVLALQHGKDQLVRLCVQDLQEALTSWQNYPASVTCFVWLLNQFAFPTLDAFISEFLPFSLRLADDWQMENKIRGVLCLGHIIQNASPTELKFYGRSDLVEDAFERLSHDRDPDLITVLYPSYVKLAEMTSSKVAPGHRRVDIRDRLAMKLLEQMEMEAKVDVKRCYARLMFDLLTLLDTRVIRWMSRLVRVFDSFLAYPDCHQEEIRILTLENMKLAFHLGGDVLNRHARDLYEMLFRVLYECSKDGGEVGDLLFYPCLETIQVLLEGSEDEFRSLSVGLDLLMVNEKFDAAVKTLMKKCND